MELAPDCRPTPVAALLDDLNEPGTHFTRTHHGVPEIAEGNYALEVTGLVGRPVRWSLADLRKLSHMTAHVVLECAGHRRTELDPVPDGVPWGLGAVGKHEYEESIEEMKHADRLIERILMLDGLPNLQDLDKVMIGENTEEMLGCDLKLELVSQTSLKEAIKYCESVSDYVSRDILTDILDDTENHIDWLQTQLELVRKVGVQNYLQSAMGEPDA